MDAAWYLCDRLRGERLLVNAEVESLNSLNASLDSKLTGLTSQVWSNTQQQILLRRLLSSHPLVTPHSTTYIAARIDACKPIEAYRRLGHHHSSIGRALSIILASPQIAADLLTAADASASQSTEDVVLAMFTLVYGSCAFPSDEKLVLDVLCQLISRQLVSGNARLVLRRGTAAFPRLYKMFSDASFASKVFLTAALHDPVMLVLCQDEIFLDVDPVKSPMRFPAAERARRFGDDSTSPLYHKKVAAHRKLIVERLVLLTHNVIKGIVDALSCFPSPLLYLVKQLHKDMSLALSVDQATLICTDLVVTNLLCPVIANPENVGVVSDTPIGHIARFNLMQIGQIIQTLALSKFETPPPHFQLFANQFRDNPICTLVETLLARPTPSIVDIFASKVTAQPGGPELFRRSHFLGSLHDVQVLISLMQGLGSDAITSSEVRDEITKISRRLPQSFSTENCVDSTCPSSENDTINSRQSRLKNFAGKVQTSLSNAQSPSRADHQSSDNYKETKPAGFPPEFYDVLIFTMEDVGEPVGRMTEDALVMSNQVIASKRNKDGKEKRARFVEHGSIVGSAVSEHTADNESDLEDEGEEDDVGSMSSSQEAPQEDRLLLLDEDGTSTLPDNVSEAGGTSGHGSPSLSGRDTPLSQAHSHAASHQPEDAEVVAAASMTAGRGAGIEERQQRALPRVPVAVRKQNAEGLEEKFGKFVVPTADNNRPYHLGDDQRSLLSESWSTNVVASDDESTTPPVPPLPPAPAPAPPAAAEEQEGLAPARSGRPVNRTGSVGGGVGNAEDKSDTWSLDAIASDSEVDGTRERDAQVQQDLGRPERELANRVGSLDLAPDLSPFMEGERLRRQASGSSGGYSRSEAGSENSKNPDEEGMRPRLPTLRPPIPPRQSSLDQTPKPSEGPSTSAQALARNSGAPSDKALDETSPGGRKRLALFHGLQKVGDKVRRGMAHSSTFGDLLGEWKDKPIVSGIPSSNSENRIAELDPRSADDILAKYEKRQVAPDVLVDLDDAPVEPAPPPPVPQPDNLQPYYTPDDVTKCRAFLDAKRKLRHVLSGTSAGHTISINESERCVRVEGEREQVLHLLRWLLAEAVNGRDTSMVAHVRETMRCLNVFDNKGVRKLLKSMREDLRKRSAYVQYLQHSRLVLLKLNSFIDNLTERIKRERTLVGECQVDVLIRLYIESKQELVRRFLHDFASGKAQDEKSETLERNLSSMYAHLPESRMWRHAAPPMMQYARRSLERILLAQIHSLAFYPNLDADRHRDELLYKALARLARAITPEHQMLRIPQSLQGEAPWPSAQAEISIINAYKSARDKIACVVRCCETISQLASLSGSSAAADDVTPILVYVLIMANPPALLSNVQYMSSFGGNLINGPEAYWWTQFTAAIEFIKTLL